MEVTELPVRAISSHYISLPTKEAGLGSKRMVPL
jgi:hypothetical protein